MTTEPPFSPPSTPDKPIRITHREWKILRDLSLRFSVSQRQYLARVLRVLDSIAETSGNDPLEILEMLVGSRRPP